MEYEREEEISPIIVAKKVGLQKLVSGHQLTGEFFSAVQAESGKEPRPQVERKDVPPPIFYDDQFGKAALFFNKIKTGATLVPALGIVYKEEKPEKRELNLTQSLKSGFYFAETRRGFSTLSTLGDPVVFFNWGLLANSRNFLLALGHEMGHTWQADTEWDFWSFLRSPSAKSLNKLTKTHPHLEEYIQDFAWIVKTAQEQDPGKKANLAKKVQNIGNNGLDMRFLEPDFPDTVEYLVQKSLDNSLRIPLGPTHPPGFFNTIRANIPAIYDVFDPMEERMAWEFALKLGFKKENCGFKTSEDRKQFMSRNLETYDKRYGVNNYTRWLENL